MCLTAAASSFTISAHHLSSRADPLASKLSISEVRINALWTFFLYCLRITDFMTFFLTDKPLQRFGNSYCCVNRSFWIFWLWCISSIHGDGCRSYISSSWSNKFWAAVCIRVRILLFERYISAFSASMFHFTYYCHFLLSHYCVTLHFPIRKSKICGVRCYCQAEKVKCYSFSCQCLKPLLSSQLTLIAYISKSWIV